MLLIHITTTTTSVISFKRKQPNLNTDTKLRRRGGCVKYFLLSKQEARPKLESQLLQIAALQKIASKLNVGFWDFTKDPCSKGGQWMNVTNTNIKRNVTCSCNTTCNVVSILLKGQNLTGILPADFANLTSLTEIDLSRNYISGSIPTAWASLPLVSVSLLGNRLSGQIPKEIGNIATLQSLVLENNMFQGPLPPALGSLTNLTRLLLSANNFTGELPQSLGNLKNLEDFRIDGNGISGSIPSFIGNWTGLQRLDMQGTSLGGPFPFTFSNLTALTDLRISDFKGDGNFPPLQKMIVMENLALRNCSLSGQIPSYIGTMSLKLLDLSFNNFTGAIPGKLAQLSSINNMYLTNNMLTGSIPSWILSSKRSLDVSYNNFSGSPSPSTCQQGNVNLVASYSSSESNVINTCLRRNQPCQGKPMNYELFINCGGMRVNFNNSEYQEDSSPIGMSTYFSSPDQKWAYSSTGDFLGSSQAKYLATNMSKLNFTNPELYMSARLSPLSLRYYGLCLQKGNYTVNLHFAEIMFTDDQTYYSVGRRIFEVSIQGQKVLKDFNIAEAANGTHKEIIKPFTAFVEDGTLEIHLQWVGKGTNAIPDRGVYGPLISAITVRPNFKPDLGHHKLSVGAIVGIVIASCVLVIMMLFFLWFYLRKSKENDELRGLELQTGYFSLRQIKTATRNFDPENKIGEGGFGPVYKGVLPDGTFIAVKQLSSKSKQGNREFVNEIGMISALQHPNLAKLFGCCIEGNQLSLIYEYLENNSLARALFGREGVRLKLDWPTRCKILLGVARGLAYLHEESILKIVHRDIKATNVLLDKDLNAKISDFGLAKLDEEENTHISTRIAGTVGYMAPEYAMRGYLTDKADVYSYGIVVLETISGKSNTNYRPKDEFVYLLDWAYVLQEQGTLLELVDPSLSSHYSKEEAQQFLNLALVCTNPSPTLRPKMSAVVSMLEGQAPVRVLSVKSGHYSNEDMRFKSFEKLSHDSQVRGFSMDGPWTNPSVSVTSSKEDMTSHTSTSKFMHDYTD